MAGELPPMIDDDHDAQVDNCSVVYLQQATPNLQNNQASYPMPSDPPT
jgi:hypothetical protein